MPQQLTIGIVMDDYKLPQLFKLLEKEKIKIVFQGPFTKNVTVVKVLSDKATISGITQAVERHYKN